MRKQQYAVIGVGRFGESIIRELTRMGHEVLAIDTDEDKVQYIADIATQAVQADSMDEKVLRSLDITSFDAVVVAIGEDIESSILTCLTLKEMGVKKSSPKLTAPCMVKCFPKSEWTWWYTRNGTWPSDWPGLWYPTVLSNILTYRRNMVSGK